MFLAAINEIGDEDIGEPLMPSGWREAVIRMMLPDVMPGLQLNDALRKLATREKEEVGFNKLQAGVQYAAARRSQIAKKMATAVRAASREENAG
ncbi:hypothetical protein D5S17_26275 [Pseudonocardiaceae bacterium YIM PH 21723]|nr:hypothetical protein D5S17_26275 [Pseudonocardiaceae bacterium YIM PH 21723]